MSNSTLLLLLKVFAVLTAALGVLQTLVGFGWVSGFGWHGRLGETGAVVVLITAVLAFLWSRLAGDKGLFMHAVGMLVIALVQIGIGMGGLREVHMVVGVLFLVGAVALATLTLRRDVSAVEAHRSTAVAG